MKLFGPAVVIALLFPALAPAGVRREGGGSQDLVFFGKQGPVLIRLQVEVDGQPVQTVFRDYCRKWVQFLDRDGDGLLNAKELRHMPDAQGMTQILQSGYYFPPPNAHKLNPADLGKNLDANVSAEDLEAYYLKAGLAPFRITPQGGPATLHPAVSETLFKALDTNGDGKLSQDEFAHGLDVLRQLDTDDDEYLSPAELAPAGGFTPPAGPGAAGVPEAFYVVPGSTNAVQLTALILAKYDKNKDGKLSRGESGLDQAAFNRLDINRDGYLSIPELVNFLTLIRPIAVLVRLGKMPPSRPLVEMKTRDNKSIQEVAGGGKASVGNVHFLLEDAQVSVRRYDLPVRAVNDAARRVYFQQFRQANPQNKPFLTVKDLEKPQFRFLAVIFPLADRNGDGKLTEAEVRKFADLTGEARRCFVSLRITEEGRALFQLLDTNRDGKLSAREIITAWSQLKHLDRDGDDQLSQDELVRQFVIEVHRGQAIFGPPQPVPGGLVRSNPGPLNPPARGPLWFQRMDVNGDGDVSEREFLGSLEEFRRIDTNGDGLIDPEEADKASKKEKEK